MVATSTGGMSPEPHTAVTPSLMPQGRVEPLNRVERSVAVKREQNLAADFGTTKHTGKLVWITELTSEVFYRPEDVIFNTRLITVKDHRQRIPRFVIRRYLEKSIQKKLFCHLQSLQIKTIFQEKSNYKLNFRKFTVAVYLWS